jgi:hypothetical protein
MPLSRHLAVGNLGGKFQGRIRNSMRLYEKSRELGSLQGTNKNNNLALIFDSLFGGVCPHRRKGLMRGQR